MKVRNVTSSAGAKKRRLRAGLFAAAVAVGLTVLAAVPAQAQTSGAVSGTVNCTGSWVYYSTTRYTTSGPLELYLTNAAGSSGGGWSDTVGVTINKTGATYNSYFGAGAPSWGTMISSGLYLSGTAFKMQAKMPTSVGTCDNAWGGTLYY